MLMCVFKASIREAKAGLRLWSHPGLHSDVTATQGAQ